MDDWDLMAVDLGGWMISKWDEDDLTVKPEVWRWDTRFCSAMVEFGPLPTMPVDYPKLSPDPEYCEFLREHLRLKDEQEKNRGFFARIWEAIVG